MDKLQILHEPSLRRPGNLGGIEVLPTRLRGEVLLRHIVLVVVMRIFIIHSIPQVSHQLSGSIAEVERYG